MENAMTGDISTLPVPIDTGRAPRSSSRNSRLTVSIVS
jgi:hypothetical protein